jgi:hypothetical protein
MTARPISGQGSASNTSVIGGRAGLYQILCFRDRRGHLVQSLKVGVGAWYRSRFFGLPCSITKFIAPALSIAAANCDDESRLGDDTIAPAAQGRGAAA